MRRITWIFLLSLSTLFSSQTVFAKDITVQFYGTVTSTNSAGSYSAGQAVEGIFVIDDSTPDSSAYAMHAEYKISEPLNATQGFTSLKVGNEVFYPNLFNNSSTVFIANDIEDGPNLTSDDVSFDMCCQAGAFSNGDHVSDLQIILRDNINNPLSSKNLTDALANLSIFATKDMVVGVSNAGGSYYIQIKIDSITSDAVPSAAVGPKNLVAFDSVVTQIDDTSGQVSSLIREGESISGNFIFDPDLVAVNPSNPEFSFYQAPGDDKNNISINFAGQTIVSNLNSDFKIEIENSDPNTSAPDRYKVSATMLNPVPLMNGLVLEDLRIEFVNPPAQILSNTELLSSTPSDLSKWYVANLYISGRNPDGSFFTIKSALSDLLQGAPDVTPMQTEELFPASGIVQMHHQFEAAAILDANRAPVDKVFSKLMNARGYIHNRCRFDGYTMTNQQRISCYGISYDLAPGMNVLRIAVHFADGTKKYYLNRWQVIE